MKQELEPIYSGIIDGDMEAVQQSVGQALEAGVDPGAVLKEGLVPAMDEVGRLFEEGDYYVPEMLIAARAMQKGLEILKPLLAETDVEPVGRVTAGTVKGDLHDIGKNLVCMMLEGAGFEIQDLGVDVPPEKFVEAAQVGNVDIVALSALLTTTMPYMQSVIQALDEAGLRGKVKVIVGGAPVTEDYARKIGADGFAPDAGQAAKLARSLIS